MKKILLVASAFLIATPVVAAPISTDHIQTVYENSKVICPTSVQLAREGHSADAIMTALISVARKHGYTDDEIALLLMFCNSYMQGAIDASPTTTV